MGHIERKAAVVFGAGRKHVEASRDHLRSDAVAADRCDPVSAHEVPFAGPLFVVGGRKARGRILPRALVEKAGYF
jgi:hypothetical protein